MTNHSAQNAANFSAFSSAADEASQADRADVRRARTSEERSVLALEMIADQLALIHLDLCAIDEFARGGGASIEAAADNREAEQELGPEAPGKGIGVHGETLAQPPSIR